MVKAKGRGERRSGSKSKKKRHKGEGKYPVRKGILSTVLEGARENKEALKYVALFLAFCAALYLVYYSLTLRGSLSILKNITTSILGAVLSFGGADVVVYGAALSINGFGLEIDLDECTAVFSSSRNAFCSRGVIPLYKYPR